MSLAPEQLLVGFQLSPQQKRVWLMEPAGRAYRAQLALELEGELRVDWLESSLRRVVGRHEILRTSFPRQPGMKVPVQAVAEEAEYAWREVDLSGLPAETKARAVEEHALAERLADTAGPPLRAALLKLSEWQHVLLVTLPALCADATTLKNLFAELAEGYAGGPQRGVPDEEVVQYAQFSEWQNELLAEGDDDESREEARAFWERQAPAQGEPDALPFERRPRAAGEFEPSRVALRFGPRTLGRIESCARRFDTSAEIFLLSCWQTLLLRLKGGEEVSVGRVFDGRGYEELRATFGLCSKFLPLRARCAEGTSFGDLLRQTERTAQECAGWAEYYGHGAAQATADGPDVGFQFTELPEEVTACGVLFTARSQYVCHEQFKLKLDCVNRRGSLLAEIQFDPRCFDGEDVRRLAEQFETLVADALERPRTSVGELELLGEAERRRLLREWNETESEYPRESCVHELFERQARQTPEAVALVCEDEWLTYAELNARANRLAHRLLGLGVGPDSRVGIFMERSAETFVALLGVLKAGGTYLPLDVSNPAQRTAAMLERGGPRVVLTQRSLRGRLGATEAHVLCLDDADAFADGDESDPRVRVQPENLVYVLFTSGSTGTPKAVAVEHRQLNNYLHAVLPLFGETRGASFATVSTLAADLGNTMIFPALCGGGTLHVITQECATDAKAFAEYVRRHAVDYLKIVPSHLAALLAGAGDGAALVRGTLVLGGEAARGGLLKDVRRLAPGCRVVNHYGPTETTVGVLTHVGDAEETLDDAATLPLGRPLPNTRVYILDGRMKPVAAGVAGEIYVGGEGVTRGYLNAPGLTAERFVPDPFSGAPGARLYRTGDLGRYGRAGRVEFLGRKDCQLKIRGHRVELGEIESALRAHEVVREAVVLVRAGLGGEPQLVAYVASAGARERAAESLRAWLSERLPEHMIPSAFVALPELPLTRNGKIDRQALAAVEPEDEREARYVAPSNEYEEVLAGIWAELLGLERVGAQDNFFELGGHSLLATQLVSRVREAFRVEVALRSLFESPTVAGLAAQVAGAARVTDLAPVTPVARGGELALSYSQQRLWFIHQLEPEDVFYNVSSGLRLRGDLNVAALEASLCELVRRHEVLRTSFSDIDGRPVQVISPASGLSLPVEDLGELAEDEREAEVTRLAEGESKRPFDLSRGPLLRVRLLRLSAEEHVLLFTMHHIVSDGWSVSVVVREVAALYRAFSSGEPSPLTELPVQYADYAAWQRERLQGEALERLLSYWKRQLRGAPPALELPTDRPRAAEQSFNSDAEQLLIPKELTGRLKELCRRHNSTLFMALLAAFASLLQRHTGKDDIVVGAPVANRGRAEIEGLIGFFLNTLVLRTDLSGDPTFGELLARVREVTLGAYAHQDVPFEKLVEELQPERSLNRTPFFQALLIFQNNPRETLTLPGLSLSHVSAVRKSSYFDLTLWASEEAGGLLLLAEYNTDLFDASTIRRLLEHLQTILERAAADPGRRLSRITSLGESEARRVLVEWNDTAREYPRGRRFQQLFEEQAARTPERAAVSCGSERLTYGELNRRANRVARGLAEQGVGADSVVALLSERGLDFLTAVLAIFKTGGAYLPLDPRHPPARLRQVLTQSGAPYVVASRRLLAALSPLLEAADGEEGHDETRPRLFSVEDLLGREGGGENLPCRARAGDRAYVIYTSGSTGRPKGVMVEQRGMLNHLYAKISDLRIDETDVLAQNASQCFDISVWQMLAPLLVGGRVHVAGDEAAYDAQALVAEVEREGVTLLEVVPSLLGAMLDSGAVVDAASPLRWLILTGEALPPELCDRWLRARPDVPVLNAYGPTECSDDVTHHAVTEPVGGRAVNIPVGRPLQNTRIYLLDARIEPAPAGAVGEIYVGGEGVARGYLSDPARTAEVFVPDAFGAEPGARLYRTGDLGRFRADGRIEFLGRVDDQVKIRGHRIELGEIEAVLRKHPSVLDAVVIAREDVPGDRRLVAYLTAESGAKAEAEPGALFQFDALRKHLRERLPEYMLPAAFVPLEALPLTPNGKIDRKALPAPDWGRPDLQKPFVAPRGPVEEALADIWQKLLGLERVGAEDNFFELGGHSLLATQVVSRMRETFGTEIPLRSLFERPTIAALAESISLAAGQAEAGDAELIGMLEALTEEEAEAMLARLSGGEAAQAFGD
jgi:amino acid adenylation domain-containing protein